MPELTINTEQYEAHHGKKPVHNQKGNWQFYVPATYGKRAWLFRDMTYKQACDQVREKASRGGLFRLAP